MDLLPEDVLVPSHSADLSETVSVRVDQDLLDSLDRIEAFLRGRGYREVSRSSLIRKAIAMFVEEMRETHLELSVALSAPTEAGRSTEMESKVSLSEHVWVLLGNGRPDAPATECEQCGAVVTNETRHIAWHRKVG